MASLTAAGTFVHSFAVSNQLIACVDFVVHSDSGANCFTNSILVFLRGQPNVVIGLSLDFNDDGHKSMLFAAQFRAVTAIDAGAIRAKPSIANKSRNRVLLDAECRHPPCVEHVVCGNQDADLLADRNH